MHIKNTQFFTDFYKYICGKCKTIMKVTILEHFLQQIFFREHFVKKISCKYNSV
jgi:hypothetical protein